MPKVWLGEQSDGTLICQVSEPRWCERRVQVEMNNSLYRQIQAAQRRYEAFQKTMAYWMSENEQGRMRRISDGH